MEDGMEPCIDSSSGMTELIKYRAFSDELVKLSSEKLPISKADLHVYKELLKGAPVKVRIHEDAHEHGGGYFDQEKKEIVLSEKNYGTLAHEVGHAQVDKHILGQIIQSRVARLAASILPLAGIGAGILMAKGKKWGLLIPAALVAPTVLSEMLATKKGRDLLKDIKTSAGQKKGYEDSMKKGLSTYVVPAIFETAKAAIIGTALGH